MAPKIKKILGVEDATKFLLIRDVGFGALNEVLREHPVNTYVGESEESIGAEIFDASSELQTWMLAASGIISTLEDALAKTCNDVTCHRFSLEDPAEIKSIPRALTFWRKTKNSYLLSIRAIITSEEEAPYKDGGLTILLGSAWFINLWINRSAGCGAPPRDKTASKLIEAVMLQITQAMRVGDYYDPCNLT